MSDIRPDSYAEWLTSLNEGDEVVVRYLWTVGQPSYKAWVRHSHKSSLTLHWMTFDDAEDGIGRHTSSFTLPGGGNTHIRIEHPTRAMNYHDDLGYEFADRVEYFRANKMLGNHL